MSDSLFIVLPYTSFSFLKASFANVGMGDENDVEQNEGRYMEWMGSPKYKVH